MASQSLDILSTNFSAYVTGRDLHIFQTRRANAFKLGIRFLGTYISSRTTHFSLYWIRVSDCETASPRH